MSKAVEAGSARTYVVEEPAGDGSADAEPSGLVLRRPASDRTYEVVDYADPLLRERLSSRPAGAAVRLDLAPAEGTDDEWIVTRALPGAPTPL
jgi:hypothetical protein